MKNVEDAQIPGHCRFHFPQFKPYSSEKFLGDRDQVVTDERRRKANGEPFLLSAVEITELIQTDFSSNRERFLKGCDAINKNGRVELYLDNLGYVCELVPCCK